jgi:hypothetical protein
MRSFVRPYFASLALVAGCAGAEEPPREPVRPPPAAVAAAPVASPFGDFIQRRPKGAGARLAVDGSSTVVLLDNQRVLFDAEGRVAGVADGPLQARGISAVPEVLGGGFVIHAGSGLYRSETPLGPMTRVLAFSVERISFGPRAALVELEDGRRRLADLASGALSPVTPAFAVSMAIATPRLAGALLADGSARISRDGGATWVAPPAHPRSFTEILVEETRQTLVLVDDQDTALRLDDQRLTQVPMPAKSAPPSKADARWIGSEEPLEAAVLRGAALDDARAIVSVRGSLFVLDRATGAIVSAEAGVLPPNRPCFALGLSRDILFACPDDGRLSVLRRPRAGGPIQAEVTFAGTGHLVRGEGDALLYTGTCEGDATKVGVACLRKKDGSWAPLDRSALFATQPAGIVLAWVPTDSSALAILGGDVGGILDGESGERSVLEKSAAQKLAAIVTPRSDAVEHRFRAVGGAIEGWSHGGDFVRIEKGGATVKLAPFKMSGVRFAGPLGLAAGPEDTLWQTRDWGKTFVEIPSPPLRVGQPVSCGEIGCTFNQWIRRGWGGEAARPKRQERHPEPAATLPRPRLPELRCSLSGKQTTSARPPDAHDSPFGLGAELLRAGEVITTWNDGASDPLGRFRTDDVVRGVESGPASRDGGIDPAGTRRLRFTLPFDPSGTIRTATVRGRDLIEASRRFGGTRPTMAELEGDGFAVPVLTAAGAASELLLVRDGIQLSTWVRAKDTVVLRTGTPEVDLGTVVAAARIDDELRLATDDGSGGVHLVIATASGFVSLLHVPALRGAAATTRTMDTVGLAPDGEPVLVRMSARTPPDANDPAMLVREKAPTTALAAWSTLAADGAPGCEGNDGVRAVVSTSPSWIQVGPSAPDSGHMIARVRWSTSRVCLEAVEVTNATHETPSGDAESQLVATFGAKPAGGLVLVGRGVELREPRKCELVAVPAAVAR